MSSVRIARWTVALVLSSGMAQGQNAAPQGNAPQPASMAAQQSTGQKGKGQGNTGTSAVPGRQRRPSGNASTSPNSTLPNPKSPNHEPTSPAATALPDSGGDSGVNESVAGPRQAGVAGKASSAGDGSAAAPAAPVSTQKVYMEGQGVRDRLASDDKPLLPIAQQTDSLGIRSGTPIRVHLKQAVDSGHARNGDMLEGVLADTVGGQPAGAPVQLTVVLSLRAGVVASFGELSLQVVSIANHRVLSEIITAQGKEGPKELPDAAPSRGTDAGFTADQVITVNAA